MLSGIGDAASGEWEEEGDLAYHVRRRLTEAEEALIGPAVDLRGTPEAESRLMALWPFLPDAARQFAMKECNSR